MRWDAATALEDELRGFVARGDLPGAIVLIEREGERLADVRVGDADRESGRPLATDAIFRWYSMTKPVTSVAVIMLVEAGRLALDTPVETLLPAFRGMRVYAGGDVDAMMTVPAARPITIEDLLTHGAGLTYQFTGTTPVHQYYHRHGVMRRTLVGERQPGDAAPARDLAELVDRLGAAPLLHQPGERFSYSYATTVLGAVVEAVVGEPLDSALQRMILDPLGMRDAVFVIDDGRLDRLTTLYALAADGLAPVETPARSEYREPDRLLDGGGALAGTAEDYLRFATMLAERGAHPGGRLLAETSVRTMLTPRLRTSGFPPVDMDFALGFAIGDERTAAAAVQPDGTASWAGSAGTYFFVDPARRATCLLMTHVIGSYALIARTAGPRAAVNRAALALLAD